MINSVAGPTPLTPPKRDAVSISQACHDVFVRCKTGVNSVMSPPVASAAKGAALGLGATVAGLAMGVNGPAGLICAASLGLALGASVQLDPRVWNGQNGPPMGLAKGVVAIAGAAAGMGLCALGANFPVNSTLLAVTMGGAAFGFTYQQLHG
ncbi:MAG: hypothetical protein ACYCW6_10480 [Candidatus Xenobia bacterium]